MGNMVFLGIVGDTLYGLFGKRTILNYTLTYVNRYVRKCNVKM